MLESVAIYREVVEPDGLVWTLPFLAIAERRFRDLQQAHQCICEALEIAVQGGRFWWSLYALPAATTLLLADLGEHERAVELYALASRHPYVDNSRWFEDVFGRHIEAIAAMLSPEVVVEARERSRARDLEAAVKELLAELAELAA